MQKTKNRIYGHLLELCYFSVLFIILKPIMEKLYIKETNETPEVNFDPVRGHMEMFGQSFPEDISKFSEDVINWMEEYANNPNKETVFEFKLSYFNTASAKMIFDVLNALETISKNGYHVVVRWHYSEDDEDMKNAGEEYEELVDVDFEHVSYTNA